VLHERLPEMEGAGVKAWRGAVAAAVGELDPEGAAHRHRLARKTRHVTLTPGEHGMATLSAHLPALDAKRVHKRLSLEAERRRAEGSREGHGAIMADALVGTLLGRDSGLELETLDIGVIITDRALLAPEHGDPAYIEGYGPVPAEALREELRQLLAPPEDPAHDRFGPDGPQIRAVMRKLYMHPTAGEIVAVESRAREFPPALKRFLMLRDGRCRAPYCDAPIRQVDHITPHSRGGATSLDNGQGTCAHDNVTKEEAYVSVERLGTGAPSSAGAPDGTGADSAVDREEHSDGHRVAWTGHSGDTVVRRAPRLGPVLASGPISDAIEDADGIQDADADGPEPEATGVTDVDACAMAGSAHRPTVTCTIPEADQQLAAPPRARRALRCRSAAGPAAGAWRHSLHGALRQAGDHPLLREHVHDHGRRHRHQVRGEGDVVVVAELGLEHLLQHRQGLQLGVRGDQARHHEVVPRAQEREDPHGRGHRRQQREDQPHEHLPRRGAVHPHRLLQ
jgi:5-methylcytosine-specific restriction endonuclease McrA